MGENDPVAMQKQVGTRRAERAPRRPRLSRQTLVLAVGITLCVVAWGYLVYAAIDFGVAARGGDGDARMFLGLASLGAIACLFVGLMLVARFGGAWGMGRLEDAPPRVAGGRRAKR
jgi:predicted metal-binding membrane protein